MTQWQRTLRALQAAGSRGVTSNEIREGLGGSFIANPAQRINELEERGHQFRVRQETTRGGARQVRYFLIFDASRALGETSRTPPASNADAHPSAAASAPPAAGGTLFNPDDLKPKPAPVSPYDADIAA